MHHHHFPLDNAPKACLPLHTNSITQPLQTVHTGHVSATFSVSIYRARRADVAPRGQHPLRYRDCVFRINLRAARMLVLSIFHCQPWFSLTLNTKAELNTGQRVVGQWPVKY